MKSTGVNKALPSGNDAAVPSGPVKNDGQTGFSSSHPISTKPEELWASNSREIKPSPKIGSPSSLNLAGRCKVAASAAAKGKFIVSDDVGKRLTFKDVTSGPNEGEVRFRLIHFWEAWNRLTKSLIGVEMLLIDEEPVNGEVPSGKLLIDEAELAASRRIDLHIQTHDESVMKVCLWDKATFEFCEKFKESGANTSVILVTTLNPKRFGGVLSLSSTTASRVFIDIDIQETRSYLSCLESNFEIANRVNATVVTKPETVTLGDLLTYMKQESAKVAWFECTTTIDDVVHGAGWYYTGCRDCHTKAIKGPTNFMCKKCGKHEIDGVPQYHSKLSVYDHKDQAVFVLLGDAGEELTGKKAAELVDSYYQANEIEGEDHIVPVPEALISTIGQTRKFVVKVSAYNLSGKSQSLTVTKVLPIEEEEPEVNNDDEAVEVPENNTEELAEDSVKRGADIIGGEEGKRPKHG